MGCTYTGGGMGVGTYTGRTGLYTGMDGKKDGAEKDGAEYDGAKEGVNEGVKDGTKPPNNCVKCRRTCGWKLLAAAASVLLAACGNNCWL